jgi:hypothetical protein
MTRTLRPEAGLRTRGRIVFLGNRTGLVRAYDTGKQILFRRDESGVDRDGAEVEFDRGTDPRNGQLIALNVTPTH